MSSSLRQAYKDSTDYYPGGVLVEPDFSRAGPQRAVHCDGYIVQIGGRDFVEYLDGPLTVRVTADFAALTGLYPKTLRAIDLNGQAVVLDYSQQQSILDRIIAGLAFLGTPVELCS